MTDSIESLRAWAAKVCGYKKAMDDPYGENGYEWLPDVAPPGKSRMSCMKWVREDLWLPDQNIAQAFEVVDAVMQLGELPHFDLHCMSPSRRWTAHIEFGFARKKDAKELPGGHASHESRCMSIVLACKAAHDAIKESTTC